MKHKQILNYLNIKDEAQLINDEIRYLVNITYNITQNDIDKVLKRWQCFLDSDKQEDEKQQVLLAIAVSFHQYSIDDKKSFQKAIKAIDYLTQNEILKPTFIKKSNEIKELLNTTVETLKRTPTRPKAMSTIKEKDVISIKLDDKYYAAYVFEMVEEKFTTPVVIFYNQIFNDIPTIEQLKGLKTYGHRYSNYKNTNKSVEVKTSFFISGLYNANDIAQQISLIASNMEFDIDDSHLEDKEICYKPNQYSCYTASSIFDMQEELENIKNRIKQ